jgi:hypothetical protein
MRAKKRGVRTKKELGERNKTCTMLVARYFRLKPRAAVAPAS